MYANRNGGADGGMRDELRNTLSGCRVRVGEHRACAFVLLNQRQRGGILIARCAHDTSAVSLLLARVNGSAIACVR
jgi:hypothetical protein